jgi:tripartite-type tricarboxylate transporter receptor subunit TctC
MGQWLAERLGQPFVIENRPGAGTNIATEAVVNAAPDGYTLLLAGVPNASNATLYGNLKFDFIRDMVPIAGILRIPNVMLVNTALPVTSVREFVNYAKGNPGKVNMASAGIGSGSHLAGELFRVMAGIELVHVPFRGNGPALTALLGGQVEVLFASPPSSIEYVKARKVRGLAVTSAARSEALPELPTVGEFIEGYEMSAWYGIAAPKGTAANVIEKLNREVNAGLADSKMKARFAQEGGILIGGSPADFARLIADETDKWGKVVRAANLKPE